MAIIGTCHVESVVGSGAASVVATCQRMEELRGIRHRKWSKIVGIIAVGQGVMEPHEIRRRKWSRVVAVTAAMPGSAGQSTEARLECLTERGGWPPV